jgi:uncharacterized membrane protein YphA (DoxX/SURF4 family)
MLAITESRIGLLPSQGVADGPLPMSSSAWDWLPPGQPFCAYATGVGHIAAGIALLSGIWSNLAAKLLIVMFASFSVFVHAPPLLAAPHSHMNWVLNAMNLS